MPIAKKADIAMNRNILFIVPDERKVYESVHVKVGAFHLPSLAFAVLASLARQCGYTPTVIDLTLGNVNQPWSQLDESLESLKPACIGITCTSATFYLAIEIAQHVKAFLPDAKVLIGGPHVSSLVEETLRHECFDFVFIGEAELSLMKFLQGLPPESIDGVAFRDKGGNVQIRKSACYLKNLDDYPVPDYSVYDLSKYRISRLQARRNPVVWIETSRGCPFDCQICNKIVHGQTFRPKSVNRVISEMKQLADLGVREFHIADDGFTSDMKRAEAICDGMIEAKLPVTWSCVNGIRVDRVSQALLQKMRAAGCYRISFGIESGNQKVLDNLGKRIKLEQIESAILLARKEGIEVFGFFIFGFIDDTEKTMQETIDFARRLPLDLAKASIMMPFPGSPLFEKYSRMNLLYPTVDYRAYNAYVPPHLVYRHPSLDWDVVSSFQRKFYRRFYFNPRYLSRRLVTSIRTGTFLSDLVSFMTMHWYGKDES